MHIYLFDFDYLKLYLFKKIISYRDELTSIVSFCSIYPTTMARNKGGGSKHKKGKNTQQVETLLLRSDNTSDNEYYAHVIKPYGNGQFGVRLVVSDGDKLLSLTEKEYRGRLSGRMRKQKRRNFVNKDDFVLISKRDFEENKVDILHVYRPEGVRKLIKMGHLPDIERVGCGDVTETKTAFEFSDEVESTPTLKSVHIPSSSEPDEALTNVVDDADEWTVSIDDI